MMTNGIVWWFLWINIIGFIFFRRWFKKQSSANGLTHYDLGLSHQKDHFAIDAVQISKTVLLMGVFLHGQLRRPLKQNWRLTLINWSVFNILVLVTPLVLLLIFQYLPLFTIGKVLLVGPGGVFIAFTHNLFHIICVLIMVIPISTWFYQITGRIYLGALLNASLATWMFVSSQVVAPIPV
jgi:hypothetical protein